MAPGSKSVKADAPSNNAASKQLSVGQLAQRAGVAVSALHYYEARGLIQSQRNAGNQRRYARDVLRRVAFIRTAQQLGIGLEEIGQALAALPEQRTPTKQDWAKLSARWRDRIDQRIDELQKLRDQLDQCIGCGCLSLANCRIYNADDALAAQGAGPRRWLGSTASRSRAARRSST